MYYSFILADLVTVIALIKSTKALWTTTKPPHFSHLDIRLLQSGHTLVHETTYVATLLPKHGLTKCSGTSCIGVGSPAEGDGHRHAPS